MTNPADDYVQNFVRDIPRSHVVPVEAVMGNVTTGPVAGTVAIGTKVRDVVGLIAHSDLPVRIVDDHSAAIGTINRGDVLAVIAGEGD